MFDITKLSLGMTSAQREELGSAFRNEQLACQENSSDCHHPQMKTARPPLSDKEFQTSCLRSKRAVAKQIPQVKIQNIGGHACISPCALLDILMPSQVPCDFYDPSKTTNKGFNATEAMEDMHERLTQSPNYFEGARIGYLLFWSDGFQVTCLRKGNGSVWILTMTVCPPLHNSKTIKASHMGHSTWTQTMGGRQETSFEQIDGRLGSPKTG